MSGVEYDSSNSILIDGESYYGIRTSKEDKNKTKVNKKVNNNVEDFNELPDLEYGNVVEGNLIKIKMGDNKYEYNRTLYRVDSVIVTGENPSNGEKASHVFAEPIDGRANPIKIKYDVMPHGFSSLRLCIVYDADSVTESFRDEVRGEYKSGHVHGHHVSDMRSISKAKIIPDTILSVFYDVSHPKITLSNL